MQPQKETAKGMCPRFTDGEYGKRNDAAVLRVLTLTLLKKRGGKERLLSVEQARYKWEEGDTLSK